MFQAKLTPTAAGRALLAKAQQGATMEFTGVRIGSGTLGSIDPDALTNVITAVKTCPITSVSRQSEKTYVKFVLTQDNTSAYYLREMALMARDPDSGEIAYMYANDGDNAELIPVPGATAFEREITIIVILSNVETVTASVQSGAYAGKEEFDAHVEDDVRHITGAEREAWNKKVGLGDDGKIPSSYLPEQENPSLEDLDGTLSIKNGGTGKSSWQQNRILYASGTTALGQLAFPGTNGSILRQDKTGAPFWSTTEELAAALGTAKIASGSYSGSGEGGQGTSVSDMIKKGRAISLPFEALAIIVSENGAASGYDNKVYVMLQGNGANTGSGHYVGCLSGNVFYAGNVYNTGGTIINGLDQPNHNYSWVAVGYGG